MTGKIINAFELVRNEIAQKRQAIQNLDNKLFPDSSELHPKPGSLIEISGTHASGKSQLLHYIMRRCVLPEEFGGKQGQIICIDTKNKFDPEVFLDQVENIIKETAGSIHAQDDADFITQVGLNCLRAVSIMHCYSAEELTLALDDVQNMLIEDATGDIILLAIDGLDDFYWVENFERKQRMQSYYMQLKERLRSICVPNNIVCAFTIGNNYSQAKTLNEAVMGSSHEYEMVLKWKPGLERTLNSLDIDINKNGLHFI